MNALTALADTCADLLREDKARIMLGEDVRDGGMLGLSRAAAKDEQLRERLLPTPLTNHGIFAHAAGLALGGKKPIVALPSAGALLEGLAALRELAALSWRSGGEQVASMTILAPSGPGFGLGGEASVSPASMLAELPGVRVLCPGRAEEMSAMLRAAVEQPQGPTIILLPRTMALAEVDTMDEALEGELDQAKTLRYGDRATVFCWGATVALAEAALDAIDDPVELIDLRSLSPLDEDSLLAAAQKTGKIVIAHAGARSHGLGAELAARFADAAILTLDAPVMRVTGSKGPFDRVHEGERLPTASAIANAVHAVINY